MEKSKLLLKLNWFYSLELNQVDLYLAQSKSMETDYLQSIFQHIAYIEQQHVDYLIAEIKKLGGTPTKVGNLVFPILGNITGTLISLSGLENVLKADIMIEKKAMEDYNNLIKALKDDPKREELVKLLQANLMDEDFHTAWFTNKLSELFPAKS